MAQGIERQQVNEIPAQQNASLGHKVNSVEECRQELANLNGSTPHPGEGESVSKKSKVRDLPPSEESEIGPIVTALLTKDCFEILLTDASENTTDVVANADFHALFVKDQAIGNCLDRYSRATADLSREGLPGWESTLQPQESSEQSSFLVGRLRTKSPHTRVLLTVKKRVPLSIYARARKYVSLLCTGLMLSPHDRELIIAAADIHSLAKLQHRDQSPNGLNVILDAGAKSLRLLNERPILVRMLQLMYCNLEKRKCRQASLELVGANILTITDLFFDTLHFDEHPSRDRRRAIGGALGNLTGKLFLKEIVNAFIAIMEEEAPKREKHDRFKRIVIYSDRPDGIYPLEGRLRNEGFQLTSTDSQESFVTLCRQQQPDIIVFRLHSLPREIIQTLQYFSGKGINVSSIPTFLLVKSTALHRLTPLLEMGIEDIIDINNNMDVLILKIKKVRAELEAFSKAPSESAQPQSGSRGNLSDMNIIDLLQALGPSQRTTRITVQQENSFFDPLQIYLAQGSIIFAELGDLLGENAIYRALGWERGTWVVEPVSEEDLPEPNSHLPNEFILMEGCRLLDESARQNSAG